MEYPALPPEFARRMRRRMIVLHCIAGLTCDNQPLLVTESSRGEERLLYHEDGNVPTRQMPPLLITEAAHKGY